MRITLVAQSPVWALDHRRDGFRDRYRGLLGILSRASTELDVLVVNEAANSPSSVADDIERATEELRHLHASAASSCASVAHFETILAMDTPSSGLQGLRRGGDAIRSLVMNRRPQPWEHRAAQLLEAWNPDVVVGLGYPNFQRLRFLTEYPRSVLMLEEDRTQDPEHGPRTRKAKAMMQLATVSERRWFPPPTVGVVIGPQEIAWATRRFPRSQIALVPHGIDVDQWRDTDPVVGTRDDFFAVGHMGHLRNAEGLVAVGRAFDRRRRSGSDGRILVVSANALHPDAGAPPRCLEMLGEINDIRPLYRSTLAALIPSFSVMGAKTTILQAWAAGCPVVTTEAAAKSVGATNGIDVLAGRDPAEVADHMLALERDPGLGNKIAQAGIARVREHHSWDAMGARFVEIIEAARQTPSARASVTRDCLARATSRLVFAGPRVAKVTGRSDR